MASPVWVPATPSVVEAAVGLAAGLTGRVAAPLAQAVVKDGLARLFSGGLPPPAAEAVVPSGEVGWFGPASTTWRVHADASMFVGGIAALMLQALHPRAMAGVADHSDFPVDPLGRLRRTAAFVGATAYGTAEEAEAACALVRRVHTRVVGTTPDGRSYAADDPDLLDWVHVAEFAAFAAAHRRFGADPMTRHELDRYVGEVAQIALALGDPTPPRSWAELDQALERHRPHLSIGEQARGAWGFLDNARLTPALMPAYRVLFAGGVACLPPWAQRLWGVPAPSSAQIAACRALVRSLGAVMGESPRLQAAQIRARPTGGKGVPSTPPRA